MAISTQHNDTYNGRTDDARTPSLSKDTSSACSRALLADRPSASTSEQTNNGKNTGTGRSSLPNELLLHIFRYVAQDTPDLISRKCVHGTSACICCKHPVRHPTRKTLIGPPLISKPDQAKRFLGYGASRQLLPVVQDALFLELRPVITMRIALGFAFKRHHTPYFGVLLQDCIDLDRLKISGWTDKLRNLRIEADVPSPNGRYKTNEIVDKALDHVANTASFFKALVALEVRIRGPGLDEVGGTGGTRETIAVELRRKLKEKKGGREIEVRLTLEKGDLIIG